MKKRLTKILALCFAVVGMLTALSGCNKSQTTTNVDDGTEREFKNTVATVASEYFRKHDPYGDFADITIKSSGMFVEEEDGRDVTYLKEGEYVTEYKENNLEGEEEQTISVKKIGDFYYVRNEEEYYEEGSEYTVDDYDVLDEYSGYSKTTYKKDLGVIVGQENVYYYRYERTLKYGKTKSEFDSAQAQTNVEIVLMSEQQYETAVRYILASINRAVALNWFDILMGEEHFDYEYERFSYENAKFTKNSVIAETFESYMTVDDPDVLLWGENWEVYLHSYFYKRNINFDGAKLGKVTEEYQEIWEDGKGIWSNSISVNNSSSITAITKLDDAEQLESFELTDFLYRIGLFF